MGVMKSDSESEIGDGEAKRIASGNWIYDNIYKGPRKHSGEVSNEQAEEEEDETKEASNSGKCSRTDELSRHSIERIDCI